MSKTFTAAVKLPLEMKAYWFELRARLLRQELTLTDWMAENILDAVADYHDPCEPTKIVEPVKKTETSKPSKLINQSAPVQDDMHERIRQQAEAASMEPPKSTLPGLRVLKTAAEVEQALDIDPRVAKAGEMFVEAVKGIAEYDGEDHIAEGVVSNILTKLKMAPRLGRDVQFWLAQNYPDRIPAGWRDK